MNNIIESQVFSGELYIKASDHHRAVAAAVAAEREACINALRELTLDHKSSDYYQGWLDVRDAGEAAIRARGQA